MPKLYAKKGHDVFRPTLLIRDTRFCRKQWIARHKQAIVGLDFGNGWYGSHPASGSTIAEVIKDYLESLEKFGYKPEWREE